MAERKNGSAQYDGVSIAEYIKKKKPEICTLIDKILMELGSDDRIAAAPTNQLSATLGALIDRFGADERDSALPDGTLSSIFEDFKEVK